MRMHPRFVLSLATALSLLPAACTYDTVGDEPSPGLDARPVGPDALAWPSPDVRLPPPGHTSPAVTPTDPAREPEAVEPPVGFEAAVVTGRDLRALVPTLVRRAVDEGRTEPHETGAAIDTLGFRGTVYSASDGEVRVARLRLEGRLDGRRVTVDLGWTDWGDGQLFDGTITHPDMTIELYDILQRDPDGTLRLGLEDGWIVEATRYELRGGSIVLSPAATDDPGERTLTAEGDLYRGDELVGGLVADDDRVVLEGPEGDVVYAALR